MFQETSITLHSWRL